MNGSIPANIVRAEVSESQMPLYLQGVAEASQRSRAVVLMLTTVSALTFFALLGQLKDFGWPQQRIAVAANVLTCWPFTNSQINLYKETGVDKSEYNHAIAFVALCANVDDTNNIAHGWLGRHPQKAMIVSNYVATYYADVQKMLSEKVRCFTIPILGVGVDINHLGLLSGLSFFILVWLLSYCIRRELENVQYTFQAAEQLNKLATYYELADSHNVLTVAPSNIKSASKEKLSFLRKCWGLFSLVFILLPSALQLVVALYETSTGTKFISIFPTSALVEICASWCLFVLIALVTYACFKTRRAHLEEWRSRAKAIGVSSEGAQIGS